jgi:uncharacterized membrane protein YdjX (TVP38/TMEM64 family)
MMNLHDIQRIQAAFQAVFDAYPALMTLAYVALFTLITALCLPGAAVLMLLAGASFGLVWGSVLATLASTAGATLTMLGARYWLRHRVEQRYGARLQAFNQSLQREGALYLLSLRLLPVIPFVPVNLISGLTRLKGATFFWVSALGMLPGTVLYVYAGVYLAQLQSMDQLLSARTAVTLMALGVLPLVVARVLRKRRLARSDSISEF